MQEQRTLHGDESDAREQERHEVGALPERAAGARRGRTRQQSQSQAGEPAHEGRIESGPPEGHLTGRSSDPDGAVPQGAPAAGQRSEHGDHHSEGPGDAEQPVTAWRAPSEASDRDGHDERSREELHQQGGGKEGAGRGGPRRTPGGGTGRCERHEAEREGRHVGADHGGAVDDRGRQSDEKGGETASGRSGEGTDDGHGGEDAHDGEQEDARPHPLRVASRHRDGSSEPREEERRLGGEHLGPEGRSVMEGIGTREIDALIEFRRGGTQPAPGGDGDDREHEGEGGDLDPARREGGPDAAKGHQTRRYCRPGHAVVTGAAGFIGSHLTERLLADGWSVLGLDALTEFTPVADKRRRLAHLSEWDGFTFVRRDLACDPLGHDVSGADVVFHLAGQPGVRGSFGPGFVHHVRRNVIATHRLLEAMTRTSGARLVLASSSSVYGEGLGRPTREDDALMPRSPYGVSKLTVEGLARCYAEQQALGLVILRYFTVYGPGQRPDMAYQRIVEAATGGGAFPMHGDGRQRRDVTYVGDIVEATLAAASRGRGTYNLGGGSPASLREAMALVAEIAGVAVPVVRMPAAPGDVRGTSADSTRARRDLDWAPRVGLREGLAAQLALTSAVRRRAVAR